MDDLKARPHRAMIDIYEQAKRETGYNATRFLQMVGEIGGPAAAHRLLASPVVSEQYRELFSEDEREGAAARLAAYGRSNA